MTFDMADFIARVAEWTPFYSVLAGVSATFAGLLFVSLSINLETLSGPSGYGIRRLARHTFGCFIYLVIFALIVIIPRQAPIGIGVPLLVTGMMALVQCLRTLRAAAREPDPRQRVREMPLYRLSMATYVVLLIVSLALLRGWAFALYLLVIVMIWQLSWATRLAWDLLVTVRDSG